MNEEEHTQAGVDAATLVMNASESANEGFVYHCRHGHCDGRDRLVFLRKMLEQGWLTLADLNDPSFRAHRPQVQRGSHSADKATASAPIEEAEPWPEPVDFLADDDLLGRPELGPDHLPDALYPFVMDTAVRMGVDPASVALAALVACAGVMDDRWQLQPKQNDYTWTENPRLWGAILGSPSVLKTPVIRTCTKPIDALDAEARQRHASDMRRYNCEASAWKAAGSDPEKAPTTPLLDRYLVEGTTIEALSEALRSDSEAKQRAPACKVLI